MIEIHKTYMGEVVVFTLNGRVDAINAPQLQKELDQTIQKGAKDNIILHMGNVNYLSAAALRVLHHLYESTGCVCIAEPSNRVRDVMQITGLDVTYSLYRRLSDALYTTRPLTNAHTRLELGWLQKGCPEPAGMPFVRWLDENIRSPLSDHPGGWDGHYRAAAQAGIEVLVQAGVSTVADISTTGLSIEPLLRAGMRGVVYIELVGHEPEKNDRILHEAKTIINRWLPKMRDDLYIGLALHAPYSVNRDLWQKALDYAREANLPLCIRVAESAAEVEYLKSGTGPLKAIYDPDGKYQAPGVSPVKFLADSGALALKPLLIHAVHVDDDDIALIKEHGCTVVHCPRSNLRLYNGRMPLEKFVAAGIPVMLGTGSLVSTPSLNILEEMEITIALHHGKVAPADIVKMVHGMLPGMVSQKKPEAPAAAPVEEPAQSEPKTKPPKPGETQATTDELSSQADKPAEKPVDEPAEKTLPQADKPAADSTE